MSGVDAYDAFVISSFAGGLFGCLFVISFGQFFDNKKQKQKDLTKHIKYLTNSQKSVVTLADLVLESGYSPKECQKLLERLVIELNADVDYTEAGKLYYQFPVSKNLELKESDKLKLKEGETYQNLIRWTEFCINHNQGIVTPVDLSLKSKISPQECKKFLNDFIAEIGGKVECTEQGEIYYQLPTFENIQIPQINDTNKVKTKSKK